MILLGFSIHEGKYRRRRWPCWPGELFTGDLSQTHDQEHHIIINETYKKNEMPASRTCTSSWNHGSTVNFETADAGDVTDH